MFCFVFLNFVVVVLFSQCFHGSTAINCVVNHAFNKFIFCQKCTHYLLWPIIKIYMYSLFFNRVFSLIYNRIIFCPVITKRRKQTKRQLCSQSKEQRVRGQREKREKRGKRIESSRDDRQAESAVGTDKLCLSFDDLNNTGDRGEGNSDVDPTTP